ncbi:hypothetical protein EBR77_01165 [bacterium]|nr:hypothetical protein [bacterium]NBX77771.1 hypothetical protein [bacterium]
MNKLALYAIMILTSGAVFGAAGAEPVERSVLVLKKPQDREAVTALYNLIYRSDSTIEDRARYDASIKAIGGTLHSGQMFSRETSVVDVVKAYGLLRDSVYTATGYPAHLPVNGAFITSDRCPYLVNPTK